MRTKSAFFSASERMRAMSWAVQAAGVDEVRARAAKLRRAGVHHVDEGLVVTGDVAGQHVGALVARRQEQAGEEVLHREGLPGAKAGV